MVNPLHFLAAAGGRLQKRDTTSWSSVVSTSFTYASQPTSITLLGYYSTYLAVSGSTTVISTYTNTTGSTYAFATSPLLTTSSPDPSCSTGYSAYGDALGWVTDTAYLPVFEAGYGTSCLPTGFYTVDYYSPGICPSGYSLAMERTLSTSISNKQTLETQGICCFTSFTLATTLPNNDWGCMTYLNPASTVSGSITLSASAAITPWTLTAAYTSVMESSSAYTTAIVSGTVITSAPTTSYTGIGTTSQLTVISGAYGASIVAPFIEVRWQSSDQAVMSWLKQQSASGITPPLNGTISPSPAPIGGKHGLSAGEIAGIVVGAVAALGLFIGGLLFFLMKRKRQARTKSSNFPDMTGSNETTTIETPTTIEIMPKSELDSRSLSPTQYSILSKTSRSPAPPEPLPAMPHPAMSPTVSELPVMHSPSQSITGNTLNERSRSPSEWTEQNVHGQGDTSFRQSDAFSRQSDMSSPVPETDMHGFLIAAPGPAGSELGGARSVGSAMSVASRSSWIEQQQGRIREEKARLTRLQELSEMEARLEEQLQRDLAEGR